MSKRSSKEDAGVAPSFPILYLRKEDFEQKGFDASKLTVSDMNKIAARIQQVFTQEGAKIENYWSLISKVAKEYELPSIVKKTYRVKLEYLQTSSNDIEARSPKEALEIMKASLACDHDLAVKGTVGFCGRGGYRMKVEEVIQAKK